MAGFTDPAENETLDAWFGSTVLGPATWHIGLMSVAHADAGTGGTEFTGNNYARINLTNNATNFPAAAAGAKSNGTVIRSNTSSGAWGTAVQLAFYEASTGGVPQVLVDIPIGQRQNIDAGNQVFEIAIGDLDFTLD
jgi:hypothetical protein